MTAQAHIERGKRQFDAFRASMDAVFGETDRLVGDAQAASARELAAMERTALAATGAAVVLTLAVGLLIVRSLTRPPRQLTGVIAR